MIDTIFKLICFVFHRRAWKRVDVYSSDMFEYDKYRCSICDAEFWDTPFDPHIPESEDVQTPVKDLPPEQKMSIKDCSEQAKHYDGPPSPYDNMK